MSTWMRWGISTPTSPSMSSSTGVLAEKRHPELPETITNIIKCKNPRCITTTEQELPQVFKLTDRENRVYRCLYCEGQAK